MAIAWFRNEYQCSRCKTSWEDEWSCMCDDRCPNCNLSISPSDSTDLSRELSVDDYRYVATLADHNLRLFETDIRVSIASDGAWIEGLLWIESGRAEATVQELMEQR
jgi:hypothetical protein